MNKATHTLESTKEYFVEIFCKNAKFRKTRGTPLCLVGPFETESSAARFAANGETVPAQLKRGDEGNRFAFSARISSTSSLKNMLYISTVGAKIAGASSKIDLYLSDRINPRMRREDNPVEYSILEALLGAWAMRQGEELDVPALPTFQNPREYVNNLNWMETLEGGIEAWGELRRGGALPNEDVFEVRFSNEVAGETGGLNSMTCFINGSPVSSGIIPSRNWLTYSILLAAGVPEELLVPVEPTF